MEKVCVFGAGAIGGTLAAHLAEAGSRVSLVARGAQLAALRERGLTLLRPGVPPVNLHTPAVSDHPRDLGPQDLVLVTVKATAVASVAAQIEPLLGRTTPVVFVVNGIPWWYPGKTAASGGAGGPLSRLLDSGRVVGAVAYSASEVIEPGVIRSDHRDDMLIVGEPDGASSPRCTAMERLFEGSTLRCQATDDIRSAIWSKLLINLAIGPMCLISRKSMKATFSDPLILAAAARVLDEGLLAATAVLGRRPPCDVETVLALVRCLDHKPSILQDVERGRPTELDALIKAPQRLARSAGIDTPTLDLLAALAEQAMPAG
jgi:2-dehydropantoate 2-reductase